jgi:hypothetical protein
MIKIDTIFTGRICMSVALVLTTSKSLLATCEIVRGSWWSTDVQLQVDNGGENT